MILRLTMLAAFCTLGALPPVGAAGPPTTCDGRPVTLVAGPGDDAVGTDADDVIVVDGARTVDAGAGDDRVCVSRLIGAQTIGIEAGDGDDRVLVQSANRRPTVIVSLGTGVNVFRGGPADEWVSGWAIVRASMGAGDDHLLATDRRWQPGDAPPQAAPYDGGPGRDRIVLGVAQDDISVDERIAGDLRTGTVVSENEGEAADVVRSRRFEDLRLYGDEVTLRGDGRANSLQGYGCSVRMVGGGGSDVLAQPQRWENHNGCRGGMTMRGGPGSDRLVGRRGPDTLLGGVGRDTAVGNAGPDRCRAEVRIRCERR